MAIDKAIFSGSTGRVARPGGSPVFGGKILAISKFLVLFALFGASAHAAIAYQNATNDLFAGTNFEINNLAEAGDQITLIPGNHLLTQVAIDVFNIDLDTSSDATLRLYNVSGSILGSLFATVTLPNITFAQFSSTKLVFPFSQLPVPNELVWTLELSNFTGLELNIFNPPTVGSSDPTTAWFRSPFGSLTLDTFDPGPGGNYQLNYNATFTVADSQTSDVPEPSAFLLTGAAILLMRRRK